MRTWKDQYASRNVGARNIGAPIITKGGVTLKELQTGKILDVIKGKDQCRDEIPTSTSSLLPATARAWPWRRWTRTWTARRSSSR